MRSQIHVEVQDCASVVAFVETNFHSLTSRRRIDDRYQRSVAAVDGVVRINQNLAQAVRIQIYRVSRGRPACKQNGDRHRRNEFHLRGLLIGLCRTDALILA